MRKVFIYVLINPLNNQIFYVGYTYNINKRLYEHIYNKNDNKYKSSVILKIKSNKLLPLIKVIDECDYIYNEDLNMYEHEKLEIYYIKKFREEGIKLTNLTDGGKNPPISKTKITVYQYDKNFNFIKKYESITEAANTFNIPVTNICCALNQKRSLTSLGYYWLTIDDINRFPIRKKVIVVRKILNRNTIPILQYDLNGNLIKEYIGQCEAERLTGISEKLINKCLRNKNYKQAGGYMWFYKNNVPDNIEKYPGKFFTRKISAFDLNNNFIQNFNSVREASIQLKLDETCISKNLKGHIKKTGNYMFKYNDL